MMKQAKVENGNGIYSVFTDVAPEPRFTEKVSLSVLVPVYNERHLVSSSLARVLELESPLISELEIIIVDDCSSDGTREILEKIAQSDPRVQLYRHNKNKGKGAAIRTALSHATCDVCIVHDADMEYYPADIPGLLVPFIEEGADVVYGSRYLTASYRRSLAFRHTLINKLLTLLSNWFTDLSLSDMETCYKAINTTLLKSIPIRSNDFRFEVEITMKLAKRRARIFETPIRYLPRTREEGKKIKPVDGLKAVMAMIKYSLLDDIYQSDEYGANILTDLQDAARFNHWMAQTLRPHVGDRVLEIGAGIGNLTKQFIPREMYVASDVNHHYLQYLRSYSMGKPYLKVTKLDAARDEDFRSLAGYFDTVLMINVLEHLPDEDSTLKNLYQVLEPGGKAVILVPQFPALYGSLDKALEHRERYTRTHLEQSLQKAGFRVEKLFDFNRFNLPFWFINGRILKHTGFSRFQLKVLEILMPFIRRIDRFCPWGGLSIIGIAVKD